MFIQGKRVFFDGTGGEGDGGGGQSGDGIGGQGSSDGGTPGAGSTGGTGGDGGGGSEGALPEGAFRTADFRAALPQDIQEHPGLGKIADLEGLARSYLSASHMVGKDPNTLMEVPDPTNSTAVRGIQTRLGLPETVAGYELKVVEGAPENFGVDQPITKVFLAAAHEAGALPGQVSLMYNRLVGALGEAEKTMLAKGDENITTNIRALEAVWGPQDGAAFKQKEAAANFAVDKLGTVKATDGTATNPLRDALNNMGLGTDPAVFTAFASIAENWMKEDSADGTGSGGGFTPAETPNEAQARGNELLAQANKTKDPVERKRLWGEAQIHFAKIGGSAAQ